MIFSDISINSKKMEISEDLFQTHKIKIAEGLDFNISTCSFYFLQKGLTKIKGHFFTENEYVFCSIDKKKGIVKKKNTLKFSDMRIKPDDPIGSGISYKIFYKYENTDWDFLFTYYFDKDELSGSGELKKFVDAVKSAIAESKTPDLKVPELADIISGESSINSDTVVKLNKKRLDKTYNELKNAGNQFLNLAQIASLDEIIYCDRFKLLGTREYYLFTDSGIIILEKTSKNLSSSEKRVEYSYREIDSLDLAYDHLEIDDIDLDDISISIKKGAHEICAVSLSIRDLFIGNPSLDFKDDLLYFKKIFGHILEKSLITKESCITDILNYFDRDIDDALMTKSFATIYRKCLVKGALLSLFKQSITVDESNEIINRIDRTYCNYLKRIDSEFSKLDKEVVALKIKLQFVNIVGSVNMAPIINAINHINEMKLLKSYIIKLLKVNNITYEQPKEWNSILFTGLREELKRNRAVIAKALAIYRNTTQKSTARKMIEESQNRTIDYIESWCKKELKNEIEKFH